MNAPAPAPTGRAGSPLVFDAIAEAANTAAAYADAAVSFAAAGDGRGVRYAIRGAAAALATAASAAQLLRPASQNGSDR